VGHESTIDTTALPPPSRVANALEEAGLQAWAVESRGRAAAAFAKVTCHELGFRSAPVVMNCYALAQLLQVATDAGSSRVPSELTELCQLKLSSAGFWIMRSESDLSRTQAPSCPYWVAVSPEGDDPTSWMTPTSQIGGGMVTDPAYSLENRSCDIGVAYCGGVRDGYSAALHVSGVALLYIAS